MTGNPERQYVLRDLNDRFRQTFQGGIVALTDGVASMPFEAGNAILTRIQRFNEFNDSADPDQEHAQGRFEQDGMKVNFRIIYLSRDFRSVSKRPEDSEATIRVLAIHLDHEI